MKAFLSKLRWRMLCEGEVLRCGDEFFSHAGRGWRYTDCPGRAVPQGLKGHYRRERWMFRAVRLGAQKCLEWLIVLAIILAILSVVLGGVWFDFHVWRLAHPAAPTWTFWFHN